MPTVDNVTRPPASGQTHIDALLSTGPGWNWLTPARNTLFFTFSTAAANPDAVGHLSGAPRALNGTQQQAALQALARLEQITGIAFVATGDAAAADLHFMAADLTGTSLAGFSSMRSTYRYRDDEVIAYDADAWVYLDNAEFAATNHNPVPGTTGYQVLLHELGHALGLKHPFEGSVRLGAAQDTTQHTLLSYTAAGGPYADFRPYDLAALAYLYGGDGLGGALGEGGAGQLLVGTSRDDQLATGGGNDRLQGGGGADRLDGGAGIDTAVYVRPRADYAVGSAGASVQALAGEEDRDRLHNVERIAFADHALAFDLDGHAGLVARLLGAVFGPAAVANPRYVGIGLEAADGGMNQDAVARLALDARLGTGFAHADAVTLLYLNLTGVPPPASDLAHWLQTLASGLHTPASLALLAADLDLNAQNIDFVGLATDGLMFV